MYNQYLNAAPPIHNEPAAEPAFSAPPEHTAPPATSAFSDLTHSLTDKLQNFKLDMDMIIVLVVAWFLLSDDGEPDYNTMLMIGALLILGI